MNEQSDYRLMIALEPQDWERARADGLRIDHGESLWVAYDNDGDLIVSSDEVDAQHPGLCYLVSDEGRHQMAALALDGQPYGFRERDVLDELWAAKLLEQFAAELERRGDENIGAATPRAIAARARFRAARIAALLRSTEVTRSAILPPRTVAQWSKQVPGDRSGFWALGVPGF